MAHDDMDRVVPLGQLDDFEVADGDPDVRGWEVLAADGRTIGEVDELLVDAHAMKVRYLDVDVDGGVIADDRHVLIPIGFARLDREHDRVMVDGLTATDLLGVPAYGQGPLTRDFEISVRNSFSRRGWDAASGGMMAAAAGLPDTAGLDNTPGIGTGMGLSASFRPVVEAADADAAPRPESAERAAAPESAYLNNADEDFYASDAFDERAFYAARRGGDAGGANPRGRP
jgi:hypothetical protein